MEVVGVFWLLPRVEGYISELDNSGCVWPGAAELLPFLRPIGAGSPLNFDWSKNNGTKVAGPEHCESISE